jgi:hypothetical protein
MNFIKRLCCEHEYEFVRNIHGDEINWCGGHRSIWRCKKCGKVSQFNIKDKCCQIGCDGGLERLNSEDYCENNYYAMLYRNAKMRPLFVKEHTAQLSKKEALVNFHETQEMKSLSNTYIQNTVTKIPFCYINGNNKIIELFYRSKETDKIKYNQNKKMYEIHYINTFRHRAVIF